MTFVSAILNDSREYILRRLPLGEGLVYYERGLKKLGYKEPETGLLEEYRRACGHS